MIYNRKTIIFAGDYETVTGNEVTKHQDSKYIMLIKGRLVILRGWIGKVYFYEATGPVFLNLIPKDLYESYN